MPSAAKRQLPKVSYRPPLWHSMHAAGQHVWVVSYVNSNNIKLVVPITTNNSNMPRAYTSSLCKHVTVQAYCDEPTTLYRSTARHSCWVSDIQSFLNCTIVSKSVAITLTTRPRMRRKARRDGCPGWVSRNTVLFFAVSGPKCAFQVLQVLLLVHFRHVTFSFIPSIHPSIVFNSGKHGPYKVTKKQTDRRHTFLVVICKLMIKTCAGLPVTELRISK